MEKRFNPFVVLSFKKYKDFIGEGLFAHPYGDHGIGHTRRVLYLACQLAKYYGLSEQEWKVLALACCYHDIGRTNDLYDESHGVMSLEKFLGLGLDGKHNITNEEYEMIRDLIIFHAMPDEQFPEDCDNRAKLMYQILKDADALDRLRFNDLDMNYLRLDRSRELIDLEFRLLRADGVIKT